ncbi:hypothetical protein POVWA2_046430 [Plasmodium ovale wallikeri]|uniref:Uncharacterized protein n=1 Tax=Plasmodium ovale wallikeri TaxID=864142 RepID=A0A1A8ZIR7_PLAOA|nr:hypothetical protein POVWA2_046430 [Plasmodium ovale wallikeri]
MGERQPPLNVSPSSRVHIDGKKYTTISEGEKKTFFEKIQRKNVYCGNNDNDVDCPGGGIKKDSFLKRWKYRSKYAWGDLSEAYVLWRGVPTSALVASSGFAMWEAACILWDALDSKDEKSVDLLCDQTYAYFTKNGREIFQRDVLPNFISNAKKLSQVRRELFDGVEDHTNRFMNDNKSELKRLANENNLCLMINWDESFIPAGEEKKKEKEEKKNDSMVILSKGAFFKIIKSCIQKSNEELLTGQENTLTETILHMSKNKEMYFITIGENTNSIKCGSNKWGNFSPCEGRRYGLIGAVGKYQMRGKNSHCKGYPLLTKDLEVIDKENVLNEVIHRSIMQVVKGTKGRGAEAEDEEAIMGTPLYRGSKKHKKCEKCKKCEMCEKCKKCEKCEKCKKCEKCEKCKKCEKCEKCKKCEKCEKCTHCAKHAKCAKCHQAAYQKVIEKHKDPLTILKSFLERDNSPLNCLKITSELRECTFQPNVWKFIEADVKSMGSKQWLGNEKKRDKNNSQELEMLHNNSDSVIVAEVRNSLLKENLMKHSNSAKRESHIKYLQLCHLHYGAKGLLIGWNCPSNNSYAGNEQLPVSGYQPFH